MQIELALFASLTAFYPGGGGRAARPMDLTDGTTIAEVIAKLDLPDAPRIIFVNNVSAEESAALQDGDRLAIFPPIAGG